MRPIVRRIELTREDKAPTGECNCETVLVSVKLSLCLNRFGYFLKSSKIILLDTQEGWISCIVRNVIVVGVDVLVSKILLGE